MVGKSILIYIEGEGGGGTTAKRHAHDGEFRQAWKAFLKPLADQAERAKIRRFRCIPGRGGASTTEKFAHPLPQQKGALRILLIDSEGPVADVAKPWTGREQKRPHWADDKHCYLMVQCLETWLLADADKLREHYDSRSKKCFQDNKLKDWSNLESISKKTLQEALESATGKCGRPYAHADGNLLIAKVQREKLRELPSVARLFKDLAQKIEEYAAAE